LELFVAPELDVLPPLPWLLDVVPPDELFAPPDELADPPVSTRVPASSLFPSTLVPLSQAVSAQLREMATWCKRIFIRWSFVAVGANALPACCAGAPLRSSRGTLGAI
jgi:hypothetical protein